MQSNVRWFLLIALTCVASDARAQQQWRTTFSDEFDGDTLDAEKWVAAPPWDARLNNELQAYVPSQVRVEDGSLKLVAEEKQNFFAGQWFDYSSGIVKSQGHFDQQYGRWEARFKSVSGRGLWPAIWLLPEPLHWPPEIDLLEIIGQDDNRIHFNVHWEDAGGAHQSDLGAWNAPFSFADDWHELRFDWTPDELVWYVDGQERHRSSEAVPDEPMFIVMNLAVGGNWPGPPDANTPFPSTFEIDWVRVSEALPTWASSAAADSWANPNAWNPAASPASDWEAMVENIHSFDQTAVASADSTVDHINISGQTNVMTVHVESGVRLTAATSVVVDSLGAVRVDGTLATGRFDVQAGGAVGVELSTTSANPITADDDVTIAAGATLTIDSPAPPAAGAHLYSVILADADSSGGGLVIGTFDTLNLPGDDGLGRRYSVLYENRAADGVGAVDTVKIGFARPGDADFNGVVDATDLIAASAAFGSGQIVTWREGNWHDVGSSQGIVDAVDLFKASPFFDSTYGSGEPPLGGDATTLGQSGDSKPSIIYDFTTGEVLIDTDGGTTTAYVLDSLAGIFSGFANHNLIGGTIFVESNANRLSENFHNSLSGVHNLGPVAQPFLNQAFLLADLTLRGGLSGSPNFEFDLVLRNTPEPSTLVLIALGLVGLAGVARRRR